MSALLNYVLYDDEGRITSSQRAPDGILLGQLLEVPEWRENYDLTHYVKNGALLARPANPATLSGARLSTLPAPCVIVINGARYECADQTADLDFTYPGTYNITVRAFPHLDATFTVATP